MSLLKRDMHSPAAARLCVFNTQPGCTRVQVLNPRACTGWEQTAGSVGARSLQHCAWQDDCDTVGKICLRLKTLRKRTCCFKHQMLCLTAAGMPGRKAVSFKCHSTGCGILELVQLERRLVVSHLLCAPCVDCIVGLQRRPEPVRHDAHMCDLAACSLLGYLVSCK
jgi:hypothetical protein